MSYKSKKYNFYFRLTDNCNFECRHCCFECKPGKETITFENAKKIIKNMPQDANIIYFSGGEVFSVKNQLYKIIEYINDNTDNLFSKKPKIGIQSNFFWLKDDNSLIDVMDELLGLNVDFLTFGGNDSFHEEQGLDLDKIFRSFDKLKNKFAGSDYPQLRKTGADLKATPLGRAKNLPKDLIDKTGHCFLNEDWSKGDFYPNINPDGRLNACCWGIPGLTMGSLLENKFEDLLENLNNDMFLTLVDKGPMDFVLEFDYLKRLKECPYGICYLCEQIFNEKPLLKNIRKN